MTEIIVIIIIISLLIISVFNKKLRILENKWFKLTNSIITLGLGLTFFLISKNVSIYLTSILCLLMLMSLITLIKVLTNKNTQLEKGNDN